MQATSFTAVGQFGRDHQFAGLYYWNLDFYQSPADPATGTTAAASAAQLRTRSA
ncbi:hypothetical protein [Gandjariella thermophila]|uniref:Uncharacterized protein n=1 Tax=Gandjariella thermophila TaxID=1931992 RepID=A0A4D4JH18_9PSEU|nr:hypothetical protein [Gandjariella thermophila]GDY33928.1 hypothetical protein GTS_55610 [Gandjariella thermophila]